MSRLYEPGETAPYVYMTTRATLANLGGSCARTPLMHRCVRCGRFTPNRRRMRRHVFWRRFYEPRPK